MWNAIAGSLALGAVLFLAQSGQAQLLQKKALSLEAARKMVATAEAEAERNHWRGVVAVVDDGGWVILLERMDHAALTAGSSLRQARRERRRFSRSPPRRLRRQSTTVVTRQ